MCSSEFSELPENSKIHFRTVWLACLKTPREEIAQGKTENEKHWTVNR